MVYCGYPRGPSLGSRELISNAILLDKWLQDVDKFNCLIMFTVESNIGPNTTPNKQVGIVGGYDTFSMLTQHPLIAFTNNLWSFLNNHQ